MDIGKPKRIIVVEPLEEPAPATAPPEEPAPPPAPEPDRTPEPVRERGRGLVRLP